MLRVDKLPEILRGALEDGVEGVVLMTKEGSPLGAEFKGTDEMKGTLLAAISSCMFNNYTLGETSAEPATAGPNLQIVQMENGILGICKVGTKYLVSAYGKNVQIGMMKLKLQGLSGYFTKIFEQVG